jgi:hypothetical protein
MAFQSPLLIIDWRGVSIMSRIFPEPYGVTFMGIQRLGLDSELMKMTRSKSEMF